MESAEADVGVVVGAAVVAAQVAVAVAVVDTVGMDCSSPGRPRLLSDSTLLLGERMRRGQRS